jgi:hypothetical protein
MARFKLLYPNLSGETEETHKNRTVGKLTGIRTMCLLNISLEQYHYTSRSVGKRFLHEEQFFSGLETFLL